MSRRIAGLADLLFEAGDATGAEELLAQRARRQEGGHRRRGACAPRWRWRSRPQSSATRPSSSAGWPQNPKDHQARFDLAMIQNAQGRREEAADNLLAIVKADRAWNDDGARAQLLQALRGLGA